MTRNDIKALFPDAPKEAIDQLLDINSTDIGKAVNKAQGTQDQLEGQVKSLHEQVTNLTEQVKTLTADGAEKDKTIKSLTSDKDKAIADLNAQHEVTLRELNTKYDTDTKALNDQLKAAQDRAAVADTLTERVSQLTKDVADREAKIASTNRHYKIADAVRNRKARNVDVVLKMLDEDKITEKDGQFEGLNEQLDALEASDAYLFDINPGNQRGGFPGAQDIGGAVDVGSVMNDAIRAMSGRSH